MTPAGAGGAHVEWAKGEHAQDSANGGSLGLTIDLRGRESQRQFEICAPCHSRRRAISSDYVHGSPFMDHFAPALLREDLYFSDGQILDEVYVYGSYQQSRKFRAGVQCSDCHEPHSGALRADGNMICTQCHSEQPPKTFPTIKPLAYDSPAHHFHKPDGPGAKCVECHMTARTYMIVDPRRDHSFRVPRPDLSVRIGTPNACTQCHRDRNDKWASAKVVEWYGANRRSGPHYGDAIQAGRIGAPGAAIMLVAVAADRGEADIVRATAVSLLGRYLDQETLPAVLEGLIDESPLVRTTTLQALEPLPAETKLQVAAPLLDDPVRAVRIEAARLLAVVPAQAMSPDMRQDFASASAEYVAAQMTMGERAEAHHNLGLFHEAARRWVEAETAYRQAIAIDPHFVPAYVNLAELARDKGDTASEELLLRQAVDAVPDNASANFAVGLFEVRRKRYAAALGYLNRAATLGPESARFSYVYAVALETTGQRMKALSILETAQRRHPWDRDVLFALASYLAVAGDRERALDYVGKLIEADPRDQRARELEFRLTNSRE